MKASDSLPDHQLSKDELVAWRGLVRISRMAVTLLDRRLSGEGGLTFAEFETLAALQRGRRKRLRMTEIAAQAGVSAATATRIVRKLEREGFVERRANASDGRSVHAVLTATGLERLRGAQDSHDAVIHAACFSRLGKGEIRKLGKLLDRAVPGAGTNREWPSA
jgi:DNA-binding MarR family transcriptional regulator